MGRTRIAMVLVVLLTIVAYWPAVHSPLLFDDTTSISHNPTIAVAWPPSQALHPPTDGPTAGRPVANYSLAANVAINRAARINADGPDSTFSFHLANIAFHLFSGLLLFGIVQRTLPALGAHWAARGDEVALLVTAIWLMHPIQTEAVNYLTQRTELLVSFCYLATLYCSIRAWNAASSRRRLGWYVAAIGACLLGVGSKEVIATAPLIVLLYDRAFRAERWSDLRRRGGFYAALFATLIPLALLVASTARARSAAHVGISAGGYLVSQGWAILHYLRLLLWPSPLAIDYGEQGVALAAALPGLLALTLAAIATLVAWRNLGHRRVVAFAGAWFFCLLAPSSSIIPVTTEIAAERRIYLALAAVAVLDVAGAEWLMRRLMPTAGIRSRRAIAGAVILLLASVTFRRSMEYRDPASLWRDAIAARPENPRAWNNLGSVLADMPAPRPGELDSVYRRAVALDSNYVPALYNLATNDIAQHHFVEAEALLRRNVTIAPNDEPALLHLGALLLMRGDPGGAAEFLQRGREQVPADPDLLALLGAAKAAAGDSAEAATLFRAALSIDASNAMAQAGLARLPPAKP